MQGKTHLMAGFALAAFADYVSAHSVKPLIHTTQDLMIVTAMSVYGSLLPDIDLPQAKINSWLSGLQLSLSIASYWILIYNQMVFEAMILIGLILTIATLPNELREYVHHREETHNIGGVFAVTIGCFVASLIFSFFYPQWLKSAILSLFLFIGYSGHIALDMMTVEGVLCDLDLAKKQLIQLLFSSNYRSHYSNTQGTGIGLANLLPDFFVPRSGGLVDNGLWLLFGFMTFHWIIWRWWPILGIHLNFIK